MRNERNSLLESLYERYYDAVYRQCLPIVNYNPRYYLLVEDCVQDAFLYAIEAYDEYKHYLNPVGWVVRVAQNKVRSRYRNELRHGNVIFPVHSEQGENVTFSVYALEEELSRRETIETIVKIYYLLSDHEKRVFVAYFLNDMSQKETAESTGLSENSVRAAIGRIRKRSRQFKNTNFLLLLGAFLSSWVTHR